MRKATSISYLIEFIPILSVQFLTSLYWPLQQKNKIGWIPLIFRINNASQTWGVLQVFTVRHTAAPPFSVHDRSVMDHRTTESVSPPWGRTHGTHAELGYTDTDQKLYTHVIHKVQRNLPYQ